MHFGEMQQIRSTIRTQTQYNRKIRCANEKWEDGEFAEFSVCQKYTLLLEAFQLLKKRLKKDFGVIFASVQQNRDAVRKQRMAELNALKAANSGKSGKKKKKKKK